MEIKDISMVSLLTNELVHHYLDKDKYPNLTSYFLRLLSSKQLSNFSQDETNSFFSMEKDQTLDTRCRLSLLFKRLKALRPAGFRERILYIICELRQDNSIAIPTKQLESLPSLASSFFETELNVIDYARDLIFTFQGIESRNFSYSEHEAAFMINSIVPASLFDLSSRLIELGWLFKKIQNFISKSINSMNSVILQSLAYKLQRNLTSYFKFTSILHNTNENNPNYVKKIWLNYQEEITSLQWMAIVCDGVEGLKGGEIVSALYNYWRNGSQLIQSLIRPLLEEVGLPLLHMIKSWMIEGELIDTFHEFFIIQDYSITRKRTWKDMFKVNSEMVPCFFSEELTKKILLTGKSLYFLRKECKEEEWSESVAEISSIVGIEQAGFHWITRVSLSTNEKLINVLFGKYRLQEHVVMVKKYLLMNQGDFHHAFMEGIYTTLDLPAAKIYKHSLVNILEAAIKSSNCQFHDYEFISRLKVVLEDIKGKQSGWEIFSLEYSVEAPLSTFFSEEISLKYRKVFNFLWKVKRIHFLINSLENMKELVKIQDQRRVYIKLRKTFFISNQISHFINTFSNYLMVDSIEGLWEKFYLKLSNARDLDELVDLHSKFIDDVMESCFISVDGVFNQILKILDICLKFYYSKEMFVMTVKEEYKRMMKPVKDDDEEVDFMRISSQSFDDIERISDLFPEEIIKFKEVLEQNDSISHKNLGVVLDFNEFYLQESLVRGGYSEFFEGYREVMQGLNKLARKY